jgi:hypothetical protein
MQEAPTPISSACTGAGLPDPLIPAPGIAAAVPDANHYAPTTAPTIAPEATRATANLSVGLAGL